MPLIPGICAIAILGLAACGEATAARLEPVPSQTDTPKEITLFHALCDLYSLPGPHSLLRFRQSYAGHKAI